MTRREPSSQRGRAGGTERRAKRWVGLVALVSTGVCVAAFTLFPVANNDIWIHLTTGRYLLQHGHLPATDPYSYTAADHPYVAHEWLAAVLFRLSYDAAGVAGMIIFKALLVAATCVLLLLAARRLHGRLAVFLPTLTAALYIASPRFVERPHVFSYLLTALYLWVLLTFRENSDWRWLWVIPPAQILWANLHGGWVVGIALVAVFALGEGIAYARGRWLEGTREQAPTACNVVLLSALLPACVVATLVNPYGARLLRFPFELESLGFVRESNFEWHPSYHPSFNTTTMFALYLLFLGALWAAFLLAPRRGVGAQIGRTRAHRISLAVACAFGVAYLALIAFRLDLVAEHWTPELLEVFLYALLAALGVNALVRHRTVDFSQTGVVALFLILSIRHNRSVSDASLAMLPFFAGAWSAVLASRKPTRLLAGRPHDEPVAWQDPSRPAVVLAGSVLMLAVSAAIFTHGYRFDALSPLRRTGLGVGPNMPVCATDFVRAQHLTGNAFVSYALAGMLIERTYPEVKVNIDSRNEVYGDELYQAYRDALDTPEAMRRFLDRYHVDFFLLPYERCNPNVLDALESSGGWAPVYYDDRNFILVRRRPGNEAFVAEHEFHLFRPTSTSSAFSVVEASRLLAETERAIRECPSSAVGYQYQGGALLMLGRYEEALAASRHAAEVAPMQPMAHLYTGLALEALGRRDEAIAAFERTLALVPGHPLAEQELHRLYSLR
jgi:hypothetical protein